MGGPTKKGDILLDRKSIVFKILKTLHNYTIEENIPKSSVECILLTGGGVELGDLANTLIQQLEVRCIDEYPKISVIKQKEPKNFIL